MNFISIGYFVDVEPTSPASISPGSEGLSVTGPQKTW
jgi:hypothetical protein